MLIIKADQIKKRGRPWALKVPSLSDLHLSEQDRNTQANSIRTDAYQLSRLFNRDLLDSIRRKDKIGMKDKVISWGIASDKVLQGVESSGIELHVPAALIERFTLALNVKQVVPQVVDIHQLP